MTALAYNGRWSLAVHQTLPQQWIFESKGAAVEWASWESSRTST